MLARRVQDFFRDRMVRNYDRAMRPLEQRALGEARRRLVGHATGRVLDLGAGTGANFAHYSTGVRNIVALDPEIGMLAFAREKRDAARVPISIVAASAEALPFPDASFDTVVATLVFCTIADPERAIVEVGRVLAPAGRVLMLEHVRPPNPVLGLAADLLTPVQRVVAVGCHLNRVTLATVQCAGLRVDSLKERLLGAVIEIVAVHTPARS
jgi:ubiquinone/menaquinone biosynthesis C-methylase UbiE